MKLRKGFTLFEMLITVIILGIIALALVQRLKDAQESWFYLSSWILEIRNNNIQGVSYEVSTQFQDQQLRDFTKFVLWTDVYFDRIWRRNDRDSTLQMREWDKYKYNIVTIYKRYMGM